MPDTKSRFLEKILEPADTEKSFSSERQLTAQAFSLHVEKRDGRSAEGFGWSHYVRYRWIDHGSHEQLIVLFGNGAVEIEGHKLMILVDEIREGQLNRVRELAGPQRALLEQSNPDNEPVIASVKCYPDFEEILSEIKGDDRDVKHTRRFER